MITKVGEPAGKAIVYPKKLFKKSERWEPKVTAKTLRHWRLKDSKVQETTSFYGIGWTNFNTELSKYAYGRLMEPRGEKYLETFVKYLLALARIEPNPAVLDVGGGGFNQWRYFLSLNPQIKFSGTALTMGLVAPELQHLVKISTAGGICRHYEKSSFDLIAAHWGAYSQNVSIVENAMRLLKIGGDLILTHPVTWDGFRTLMKALERYDNRILKVASSEEENFRMTQTDTYCFSYRYTLQIRKLAEP
ncbi:MAG: hypothetical protein WC861_02965 [Candidatus Micrarchaeia archaeon]|jgi:hypothetical protein